MNPEKTDVPATVPDRNGCSGGQGQVNMAVDAQRRRIRLTVLILSLLSRQVPGDMPDSGGA